MVKTYTAKSYEYGEDVSVSSNLEFIIQSPTLALYQDTENTDRYYSQKEYTSVYQVSDFDASQNDYYFVLNGKKFYNVEMEYGHLKCSLNFTFVSTTNEDLFTDELIITIDFQSNTTDVLVETFGGANAFGYWQVYFNSNGFDMRVYKI